LAENIKNCTWERCQLAEKGADRDEGVHMATRNRTSGENEEGKRDGIYEGTEEGGKEGTRCEGPIL
jgi:hypothetical protein